jgi:hypothetical protein
MAKCVVKKPPTGVKGAFEEAGRPWSLLKKPSVRTFRQEGMCLTKLTVTAASASKNSKGAHINW